EIPDPRDSIVARRDQEPRADRAPHGERTDRLAGIADVPRLALAQVPQPRRAVARSGHQALAIGSEHHRTDRGIARDRGDPTKRVELPDLDRAVAVEHREP